jgi:hypothetical protein
MNPALYYVRPPVEARRHVRFLAWWYFLSARGRANYQRARAAMMLDHVTLWHPAALRPKGVG